MTVHFHEEDLPEGVLAPGPVAVDTETMGLQPGRDRLCLVQISDGRGDEHLVRFGAGQRLCRAQPQGGARRSRRGSSSIISPASTSPRSSAYLGVMAAPVYCTKTASRLVRTYTDRHGLKDLVKELLGQEISKQQQSSDWGAPELTDAQKEYAASDVRYLHALKEKLDERLAREGRTALAQACFDFLPHRAAARSRRLGRAGHLRPCLSLPSANGAVKRGWAAPGGATIALIRAAEDRAAGADRRRSSPSSLFAPLEDKQEVSFLLDKNKVETRRGAAAGRSRPQYRGQDDQGRPFVLNARSARAGRPRPIRSSRSAT